MNHFVELDQDFVDLMNLVSALNEVLHFRTESSFAAARLNEIISDAVSSISLGNRDQFVRHYLLLLKLKTDFDRVRSYSKSMVREYSSRLNKAGELEYRGARFELAIASSFVKDHIKFYRPKGKSISTPDFQVEYGNDNISIECTAPQIISTDANDLYYKVESAISGKLQKPYMNHSTALFIDVTRLQYGSSGRKEDFMKNPELKHWLRAFTDKKVIGAVVLFLYSINMSEREQVFESGYKRSDCQGCSETLRSFLDSYFPIGDHFVLECAVPHQP